jgi:hypothetical protein
LVLNFSVEASCTLMEHGQILSPCCVYIYVCVCVCVCVCIYIYIVQKMQINSVRSGR